MEYRIILFGNPPWEKKPPCLFRNPVCTPEVAPEAGTVAVAICKFSSMSSVIHAKPKQMYWNWRYRDAYRVGPSSLQYY